MQTIVQHGRVMWLLGFITGITVGASIAATLGLTFS